ncbi:choline ABC transporter permease subunit [Cypionkella sp.]|jgi:glycine betaine/proline transport system permease protein|uniref:choline ABC transporter permease subunit n=1 Tax=Cypionkella sp. TaxID=2811411 RepID=UPI0037505871
MDWLTAYKLPIGAWANTIFLWMKVNLVWAFNALAKALEWLIEGFLWLLQTPNPLVIIAVFMAIAWAMQRNWKTVIGVGLGFLFIINQGYWKETTESLTLIVSACAVCMALGVPIGIACAHRPRLNEALAPVLDLMQTLPTMVYLIPAVVFFGLGMVPGLVATVIFVLPAPIRLTELGISSTPIALKEAATAFGATPSQKLWKVELPWALPQIMVGLNQTIMLSLSMVVIAAMVGANGVGIPVLRALQSMNIAKGFESGMVIVVIAITLRATFQRKG